MKNKLDIPDLNFDNMAKSVNSKNNLTIEDYKKRVIILLENLQNQSKNNGTVDLRKMFELQYAMQMISQYIEQTSNEMSTIHNLMMLLARSQKGQ